MARAAAGSSEFAAAGPDVAARRAGRRGRGRPPRPSRRLRDWLRDVYAPAVEGAPDTVGRERYARWSRYFNGTDLDLDEAYAYGWSEYHRLLAEMRTEAGEDPARRGDPWEALRPPRRARRAHRGGRRGPRLAPGPDGRGDRGAGRHPLRTRRAGTAGGVPDRARPAARRRRTTPRPSRGLLAARAAPGCPPWARPASPSTTWSSTWYHEGVPGHHLQLAQWAHVADRLSRYQATVGMVSANAEGWALYAERLMDELGFLPDPERRLGYLDAQMMRAVPGDRRHRHASGAGDPGGLAVPPGRALDAGAGAGVLRAPQRPAGGLRARAS